MCSFIDKAKQTHGDKYDYSRVVYVNTHTKVEIICPEHGVFLQTPAKHLQGQGCPYCSGTKKHTKESFIEKARAIHGDKYDYSKVEYVNNRTNVCIICPEHGEFWQTPHNHLKGKGCPDCAKKKIDKKTKPTPVSKEEKLLIKGKLFQEKAIRIHGNKYEYHPEEYLGYGIKTRITCKKHGDFYQTPGNHLAGKGCQKCANEKHSLDRLSNTEKFIEKAREIHGDKYDYSNVVYKDAHSKVCIICPEHGEFWQIPNDHTSQKHGCPKCAGNERITVKEFKEKCCEIFGGKYSYDNVTEIKNNRLKVDIICPKHGTFSMAVGNHLSGHGCPSCGNNISKPENELYDFLIQNNFNVIKNDRSMLNGKELDLYLPDENLAIEYNGLLWHSEQYRPDKNYHLSKLEECNNKGIRLITIFEDEWNEHEDVVIEKVKNVLHLNEDKTVYGARKCAIKHISKETADTFLNKYHIQGSGHASIRYGAYTKDNTLIGVMMFKEEIKGSNKWELTRFATNYHYSCPGLGSKMFQHFIKELTPEEVKSFADRRWTLDKDNNLYTKIGFTLDKIEIPDYSYVFKKQRLHKFCFRKQKLHKKYGLPLELTEKQMCDMIGAYRIWNCGLLKYVWTKKTTAN